MIKFKRGKWELHHRRYTDEYGFEHDSVVVVDSENNINYPLMPKVKASDYNKDDAVGIIKYEFTEKDYLEMLDEAVEEITK